MSRETRLRGVALLALVGLFVALYLFLYSLGLYGALLCGPGSCDVVQASKYARFLGLPVPGWGVAWYVAVFALALGAMTRRATPGGWTDRLLAIACTGGLAFSIYLTVVELFIIHAICQWCVVSAALTVAIFLLVAPWRAVRTA